MNIISRLSQGTDVRLGDQKMSSLLFADDLILLMSWSKGLQLSLERLAADCEAAGLRISTSKSETVVLSRKRVEISFWLGLRCCLVWRSFKLNLMLEF